MSVDVKCHDLARFFLEDAGFTHSSDADKLAQDIQDTIEDYMADLQNEEIEHHAGR